jgi:NAD(P)H-flavin reductase/ferredoxin
MTYAVKIHNTDIAFPCEAGETVLDAAERAGFSLPYSCRKGRCATCEGRLLAGELEVRGRGSLKGPTDGVLLCQAHPRSAVEIAPTRIVKRALAQRLAIVAKVYRISRPAPDVAVLQLRFPTGTRATFRAGQYLQVLMENGDTRNYSMANPPHTNDGVELHIRRVSGGRFSEAVLNRLDKGHTLRVELPFGEFCLNEDSSKPVILVATGTGFAPMKSIIEDQMKLGMKRRMQLYWGARTPSDLYLSELLRKWSEHTPSLTCTPVVSELSEGWTGRRGLVHHAVLTDHPDLRGFEVYACGNPAMIDAARLDFTTQGRLQLDDFHCDVFVASGSTVSGEEGPSRA